MTPKERIVVSISVPIEEKHVLEQFDKLARLERIGRSELTIRAWKEYIDHHFPGNPQTVLMPPPIADPTRDRAAINFLRYRIKLPFRQIAKIVGRSKGYVIKWATTHGRGEGYRGMRVNPGTLRKYRERFRGWIEGRYDTLEEAFRLA